MTSLQFTYTASATMTSGVVSVAVPAGWTTPTTTNTIASTGTVSVVGSTITVRAVTLTSSQTLTITYGTGSNLVTTSLAAGGYDTFTVSMSPTSSGTLSPLSPSPVVFVYTKASPALLADVTTVPLAIFNTVGITSHAIAVDPPMIKRHLGQLFTELHGKKVPASFFLGGEYCPYCGPTSWGIIVALGRFGSFNQLYEVESSPTDVYPNTPSFTFHMSKYTSRFLTFGGYEVAGPFEEQLQTPPKEIQKLVNAYDPFGALPFMDGGSLMFIDASTMDPGALAGLSQVEIASNLSDASNSVTKAIIAQANYLSAGFCASDGEKPAAVCDSGGVKKADTALGLRRP